MSIADNIEKIEGRISRACSASGRKREEITLLCVSKFQDVSAVQEAWDAGIRDFGESRVKEGIDKFTAFRQTHSIESVHLIGSLQRNKAKAAAGFFDCVQSVDRLELIPQLSLQAGPMPGSHVRERPLDILFELHTGEESKCGFPDIDSLCSAAELALSLPNLRVMGLMTMAPFTGEVQAIRGAFRLLYTAREALEKRFPSGALCSWGCLSMGMSGDLEIAVEEGSTMLRIGSAIFGNDYV